MQKTGTAGPLVVIGVVTSPSGMSAYSTSMSAAEPLEVGHHVAGCRAVDRRHLHSGQRSEVGVTLTGRVVPGLPAGAASLYVVGLHVHLPPRWTGTAAQTPAHRGKFTAYDPQCPCGQASSSAAGAGPEPNIRSQISRYSRSGEGTWSMVCSAWS